MVLRSVRIFSEGQVSVTEPDHCMIITLIGYRGCGKSTVGPLLALRLGARCVDSDDVVEQRAGKTIAEIFADDGEAAFRALESTVLAELVTENELVIAVGGGAILREENRVRMKSAGAVVWLRVAPELLAQRISADSTSGQRRPSLTGKSITEEVAEVLAQRDPLYRDAATMVVDAGESTPDELCSIICQRLACENSGASS